MIDKNKLIEVIAEAVRLVNFYGEHDAHESLVGSQIIAAAALQAICRELSDMLEVKHFGGQEFGCYVELYNQLKEIGND